MGAETDGPAHGLTNKGRMQIGMIGLDGWMGIFAEKVVSAMRQRFGGHVEETAQE